MSNYDVLGCYPKYMQDIEEIKCISEIERDYLIFMQTEKNFMLNEVDIISFNVGGRKRWENILGGLDKGYSFAFTIYDEVKRKINQPKIVTMESITEYLNWWMKEGNYTAVFDSEANILTVTVGNVKTSEFSTKKLYTRLREYLPCNIIIKIEEE